MPEKRDLYNTESRMQTALSKLEEAKIPAQSRKDIKNFATAMQAQGIKKIRILKTVYVLAPFAASLKKPFKNATKKDIEKLIAKLENNKNYAPWTKADYKTVLKRFYKWLLGNDEFYPDCIKWLKIKSPSDNQLPEGLITEEELLKIVSSATNPRDKAFIFTLYESGGRIGEILPLRIKDIQFGEQITSIMVDGKTGARRIPLVSATKYLATWLNMHPLKDNPDAPLWVKSVNRNKESKGEVQELSHSGIRKMLKTTFAKANVSKKCNPHQFRHSRATELATKLTEAQMKELFGWKQDSDMAARYVHLSGRDVDSAILMINGLKPKEDIKESKLKPRACSRCEERNPPNASYCFKCAMPLDVDTVQKEELEKKIKDKALLEYMKEPDGFFERMYDMEKQLRDLQAKVK